ncbi:MAG: DegT/DnrJ/EryC1/StrS family aminotransferase [Proteobacteria bacterium]|nr:DegT/DnrJ/EryC1/StrS family aminotransferase [Pseudomonadota bacterium]
MSTLPKSDDIQMAGPWVTEEDIAIVTNMLRNGWYGKDAYAYVEKFEREFAGWHNRKYGLMTPNCTTSIHLLLAGLGIKDDDEVIVPECTWIASVAPVVYQRAKPVFADIDPVHWCVTPDTVKKCITKKTKALIAVDLFGNMPEMDALQKICDDAGIYLIEDAAEALGSTYQNIRAGKFGVGSVFSFHRTKTITTGEGGILLLDDDKLFERCKFLRDHGRSPGTYYNTEVTFKYMPSNLQASLAYAQFKRIDELVERKRWIWKTFRSYLKDIPDLYLNPEPRNVYNGVWCPALVFGKSYGITKEQAMDRLGKLGLPVRPFFYPLTSLPAFPQYAADGPKNCPVAYDVSNRGINLPCAYTLSENQIAHYADGIRKILGG